MEGIVLLDSSVLISYYRKKDKEKTFLFALSNEFSGYCISVVTEFETLTGGDESFWENLFSDFLIAPYNTALNSIALSVKQQLKKKRRSIDFRDLIIASTALHLGIPLATTNERDFAYIDKLHLITPKDFGL